MRWGIINKTKSIQPETGNYSTWKGDLAIEGGNRCVYCGTKDHRLGGIRHFHVEHYRPKSLFPSLKNDILNLYYACPICNIFKSDEWYEVSGNLSDIFYPDPSTFDYQELFVINKDGVIDSNSNCGKYLINKLGLNRRQLVLDRQFSFLLFGYSALNEEYRGIRDSLIQENTEESKAVLMKLVRAYDQVIDRKDQMFENAPYEFEDTKRS